MASFYLVAKQSDSHCISGGDAFLYHASGLQGFSHIVAITLEIVHVSGISGVRSLGFNLRQQLYTSSIATTDCTHWRKADTCISEYTIAYFLLIQRRWLHTNAHSTMSPTQQAQTESIDGQSNNGSDKKIKSRRPASELQSISLNTWYQRCRLTLLILDTAFRQQRLKAWQFVDVWHSFLLIMLTNLLDRFLHLRLSCRFSSSSV